MIVVSDTSPLNYLILIDAIEVLPALLGRTITTPEVTAELLHAKADSRVRHWAANLPRWLEVQSPREEPPWPHLGAGEAAAIQLAVELRQAGRVRLLIDDREGREQAHRVGLETRGTLAVLAEAGQRGLIDITQAIDKLRRTSFHAPPALLEQALKHGRRGVQ
jgi:predicted nucleic acid-binding protein